MAVKGAKMKKNGFTLIELLVVIVVVGILATFVVGGANYAVRVSREKRRMISCQTLQTAIYRYRTEYNEWPGGVTPSKGKTSHTFSDEDNAKVFGMLRTSNEKDNPDGINFIDETAFFTKDPEEDGAVIKLSDPKVRSGNKPLVYIARSGRWTNKEGKYLYYRVTIDFDDETVTVDTKGMLNGSLVDLFFDEDEAEKRD